MNKITLESDGQIIRLTVADHTSRFHAIWLRDNALDPATRSASNGQRLITIQDIDAKLFVSHTQVTQDVLTVTFMPEKKTVDFPLNWLLSHAYDKPIETTKGWHKANQTLWDSSLMASLPEAEFDAAVTSPQTLKVWLKQIAQFGFAKLNAGPVHAGALTQVVDLFGHLRETNYGRIFEVRVEEKPTNLAYTGLALQAHTDNPYRDPVPTLSLIHI